MKRREAIISLGCMAIIGPSLFSCKERSDTMKQEINTQNAPKAIGPYSQGIIANGFVFASGQIPLDPATGELNIGSVEEQAHLALTNLKAVIEASGSSMDLVVKCTVFLQNMDDYGAVNAIYGEYFKSPYPARAAIQVARLPKDVKVEIEAIAIL
ncbi:MAG: RidA family protein [Candidatus Aminicenantaceae bacterium]